MSENLEMNEIEALLEERRNYYLQNVHPKILELAMLVKKSKYFRRKDCKGYSEDIFIMKGMKFKFNYSYSDEDVPKFRLEISHKFRTVLYVYNYPNTDPIVTLYIFRECDWTKRLDDVIAEVKRREIKYAKKSAESRMRKLCKNFEKRCD